MTVLNTNITTFQEGSIAVNNDDLIIKLRKQIDLLTNKLATLVDQENELLENNTLTDLEINTKMDEIEKSKTLFSKRLNKATENLNEFLKFKINNNKEKFYNSDNFIKENSINNNKKDLLNNDSNNKITIEQHIQNVVLLFSKEDNGKYYTCYNCRGEKIQFYWESESAKIEYTLKTLDDFPIWSSYIKDFLQNGILIIY